MLIIVLFCRFGRNCQESYRQYTIGCQCSFPMRGKKPAICYIFRPLCLHSKEWFKAVGHSRCRLASLYTCRCRDAALEQWKERNQQDFCVRHATSENSDHTLSLKQSEDKARETELRQIEGAVGYQEGTRGCEIRYKCTYPKAWNTDFLIVTGMAIILCFRNA